MRLAWLTDLHLDFVAPHRTARLAAEILACGPDAVLIGGDIADGSTFAPALHNLADRTGLPIYFVLGNHDYYHKSVAEAREAARRLIRDSDLLHWLPEAGVVALDGQTTLVGHDGWGDGRIGNFFASNVVLTDYLLIDDLREAAGIDIGTASTGVLPTRAILNAGLLARLEALGDEAAAHFRRVLPAALESARHVFVLTHVPPFREACRYQGRPTDDNWAPHFTCRAVGDVLLEQMQRRPDRRMTVLCGHTHHAAHARILPNLEVITGAAEYGAPHVERVFETDDVPQPTGQQAGLG